MRVLVGGRGQENEDVKMHCPTLMGGFYFFPWFALNPVYENENFFFIEGVGNEEVRLSTMLEF